jgi:hypothetical protein
MSEKVSDDIYSKAFVDLREGCSSVDCYYYEDGKCQHPTPQYALEISVTPGSLKLPKWKSLCSSFLDGFSSQW